MTNEEFETQMRKIIKKAGEASGLGFEEWSVSVDPDRLADYGVDYEGNLVLYEDSYPLKVSDIIAIQYRWNEYMDEGFFRFKFKNDLKFYINFSAEECVYEFWVLYKNNSLAFTVLYNSHINRDVTEYLNSILESDDTN